MIYRVTEVPKGNIPAHELLYRILELGPLSCDRNSQIQVGPLTVYPGLVHPKDGGPAGQTGLCKVTSSPHLLVLGHPLPACFLQLTYEHQHPQQGIFVPLGIPLASGEK